MSKKMIGFLVHSDPDNEWLEVSLEDIANVGLSPSSFSEASFRDGDTMFLDADEDADRFMAAFEHESGGSVLVMVSIEEYEEPCYITSLRRNGGYDA